MNYSVVIKLALRQMLINAAEVLNCWAPCFAQHHSERFPTFYLYEGLHFFQPIALL